MTDPIDEFFIKTHINVAKMKGYGNIKGNEHWFRDDIRLLRTRLATNCSLTYKEIPKEQQLELLQNIVKDALMLTHQLKGEQE